MTANDKSKIDVLLASLWERGLPLLRERLAILDQTARAVEAGDLSETLRTQALEIAHKFAGSLGMFGYAQGTALSQQLEQLLENSTPIDPSHLAGLVTKLRETLQQ